MTTTPVLTCTDDLLGEIEAHCANWLPGDGELISGHELRALLTRLRAAEVDAGRYQGMRAIVMKSTGMTEEEYNSRADNVIALDAEREAKQ